MNWNFVSDRPIEGGYVAIGWSEMGDLSKIPANREAFKEVLALAYPDKKKGAIPVDARSMFKFLHETKAGDFVVYPSKADRMVNIGGFKGIVQHHADDPDEHPTRQLADWLGHFPRDEFSQSALNEIGLFFTMFRAERHALEFLSKVDPVIPPKISGVHK